MVLLPSAWGEQVLGSFTTWGLVGSSPGFDDSARFIIGHGSDVFDINPLGDDRLVLASASTQSFTYRSDADDPNYSAMVTRLTNGTNDPVSIFLAFGHSVTRSGLVISESSAFLVLCDFVGCRITGLRVIIDPFRIGPWSVGGTIIEHPYGGEFRYRWEVLGEPPYRRTPRTTSISILRILRLPTPTGPLRPGTSRPRWTWRDPERS